MATSVAVPSAASAGAAYALVSVSGVSLLVECTRPRQTNLDTILSVFASMWTTVLTLLSCLDSDAIDDEVLDVLSLLQAVVQLNCTLSFVARRCAARRCGCSSPHTQRRRRLPQLQGCMHSPVSQSSTCCSAECCELPMQHDVNMGSARGGASKHQRHWLEAGSSVCDKHGGTTPLKIGVRFRVMHCAL